MDVKFISINLVRNIQKKNITHNWAEGWRDKQIYNETERTIDLHKDGRRDRLGENVIFGGAFLLKRLKIMNQTKLEYQKWGIFGGKRKYKS